MAEAKETKKRQAQPGMKRVTITLTDAQYAQLTTAAKADDREVNNFLSRKVRINFGMLMADAKPLELQQV